ncbi:hypothetical protein AB0M47_16185 [Hamadaea sp. NPDC051192]|uniref:hypothetical protein n=1 Tax=Hamadaea sp. NPDC051192 TaxID=3154940 RepID=UPI00341EA900
MQEWETEIARLDDRFRPIAQASTPSRDLPAEASAERVLRSLINVYAESTEPDRAALRRLLDRYRYFRWGAHLPYEWTGAAEFRARLIHLSLVDQGDDTRDEILTLRDYCTRAYAEGIEVAPIVAEVVTMSSDVDKYGMGSMKAVLSAYAS